jgi:hypothetical protein
VGWNPTASSISEMKLRIDKNSMLQEEIDTLKIGAELIIELRFSNGKESLRIGCVQEVNSDVIIVRPYKSMEKLIRNHEDKLKPIFTIQKHPHTSIFV